MWTVRLNGVPGRFQQSAVSVNGKIYSFDNYSPGSTRILNNRADVFIFDPSSQRWDVIQTQSSADRGPNRISHRSVVAYGQCLYLWGFLASSPPQSVLYRLDTTTMTWSCPGVSGEVPRPRNSTCACVVEHHMYVFGDLNYPQNVWVLDFDTMEWRLVLTTGEAPTRRFSHNASAIGTRMYVWGCNSPHYLDDNGFESNSSLYCLETANLTWRIPHVHGASPVGRFSHSAFVYKEQLYIFGGYNAQVGTYFADIHKYDPETSCWSVVKPSGSGPSARSSHGCCATGERVFIFGGIGPTQNEEGTDGYPSAELLTDLHVLHLAPTLQNLCLLAVIDARLDVSRLPLIIRKQIKAMTSSNS